MKSLKSSSFSATILTRVKDLLMLHISAWRSLRFLEKEKIRSLSQRLGMRIFFGMEAAIITSEEFCLKV